MDILKSGLMYGIFCVSGGVMKNFRFNTINFATAFILRSRP